MRGPQLVRRVWFVLPLAVAITSTSFAMLSPMMQATSKNSSIRTLATSNLPRINCNDLSFRRHWSFPLRATEGSPGDDSISSCPFSKTFPRYRIDLTTPKRENGNDGDIWSFLRVPKVEMPWKEAIQRGQLEAAIAKGGKKREHVLFLRADLDGASAFSWLWEESAQLMGMGLTKAPEHSTVVLGLPNASESVVRNFCEIVTWMAEQESLSKEVLLEAEFLNDGTEIPFPAVRLQRISTIDQMMLHNDSKREELINERTRMWVKRILVEQGICPFTKSDRMSGQGLKDLGVPVGSIAYHASFQNHPIGLFADTWKAIDEMLRAGPEGKTGVSSILLAAQEFDHDFDLWAGPIFAMLEAGVVAAGAESEIGVVCFHPRYATPDGKSWPGFGHMHSVPKLERWYRETYQEQGQSEEETMQLTTEQIAAGGAWQRRTPHATINVLRADQLEAAESRRISGKMYTKNIDILVGVEGIGNDQLALDLERERQLGSM